MRRQVKRRIFKRSKESGVRSSKFEVRSPESGVVELLRLFSIALIFFILAQITVETMILRIKFEIFGSRGKLLKRISKEI
jgi:hypothetical protein